jgi:rSAM/selenodomain-associated transferase 2
MTSETSLQLSIIVPVLNEAAGLPELLASLSAQVDVNFELIVSDGGSSDGSAELARNIAHDSIIPCTIVECESGRGRQLNAGAALARSDSLLFLHADSRFADPKALRRALDALEEVIARRGDEMAAARFALRFRRQEEAPSIPYFISEAKARLNRPGCIHGDQGFLLRRAFFLRIGPFDESFPFLEDAEISEKVFREGEWVLAPAEIETSARRFEIEGLFERHTLNALIMNFFHIGCSDLLRRLPHVYRSQDRTARLDLQPFFQEIRLYLSRLPLRQRLLLWYRTGAYIRANAWQLPFAWDQRRHFRRKLPPGTGENIWLKRFERSIVPLIDNRPAQLLTAILTRIWFEVMIRKGRSQEPESRSQEPE